MRKASLLLNILGGFLLILTILSAGCKDENEPDPTEGLKAAFSASPFEGNSPLLVNFSDESTGSPVSWKWDFQGDGSFDDFLKDPTYTYDEPGYYDVKLVVSNDNASDSLTILNYIYLNRDDVKLNYVSSLSPNVGELTEIPLKIGHDAEFGAMTIKLYYDNRIIEVQSIEGDVEGFLSGIEHETGSISIAWSSVNSLVLKQNDDLFRIRATILASIEPVSHYMRIGAGTEFADPSASILSDIELIIPFLDTQE